MESYGVCGTRAQDQIELVKRMTRISTRIIPDDEGIDLVFINSDGVANAREAEVELKMKTTRPSSGTPIGTRLKQKILNPLVYSVINHGNGQFKRPLLISIITDGAPTQEEGVLPSLSNTKAVFEAAVIDCIDQLRHRGYPDNGTFVRTSSFLHDVFGFWLLTVNSRCLPDKPNRQRCPRYRLLDDAVRALQECQIIILHTS